MEPISMLVAVGILVLGGGIGYTAGRRGRKAAGTAKAICESCQHGLGHHDEHGVCHATVKTTKYSKSGSPIGYDYVPCTCQQYVGPIPLERMLASFTPMALPSNQAASRPERASE